MCSFLLKTSHLNDNLSIFLGFIGFTRIKLVTSLTRWLLYLKCENIQIEPQLNRGSGHMDAIRIHRARQHRSQGPSFLFFVLNQRKSVFNLQKYFSQWGMAPDGKFNSPTCYRYSLMGRGDRVGEREARQFSWPQHDGRRGDPYVLGCLGIWHAGEGDVTSWNDFSGGSS